MNPCPVTIKIPDITVCLQRGWVALPPVLARGYTGQGLPRKYRQGQLSNKEYLKLRRRQFSAAGLTARGTVRKNRTWKNWATIP